MFVAPLRLAGFSGGRRSRAQPASEAQVLCIWCLCAPSQTRPQASMWLQSHGCPGPMLCRGLSPPLLERWQASGTAARGGRNRFLSGQPRPSSSWPAFRSAPVWLCTWSWFAATGGRSATRPVRTMQGARWPARRRSVCRSGRGRGGALQHTSPRADKGSQGTMRSPLWGRSSLCGLGLHWSTRLPCFCSLCGSSGTVCRGSPDCASFLLLLPISQEMIPSGRLGRTVSLVSDSWLQLSPWSRS